jgi:hypothetical protein
MNENETYNGWTGKGNHASAYATWRVSLELCDDICNSLVGALADYLKETCQDLICGEDYHQETIATQYAMAFLDDVSWDEIAEHNDELIASEDVA